MAQLRLIKCNRWTEITPIIEVIYHCKAIIIAATWAINICLLINGCLIVLHLCVDLTFGQTWQLQGGAPPSYVNVGL